MTLSGSTTPGQSGTGKDDNEEVLFIPQSSSITGTSPSDCFVLYPGHSLVGVLHLCRGAVGVFSSPSRLGNWLFVFFKSYTDERATLFNSWYYVLLVRPCRVDTFKAARCFKEFRSVCSNLDQTSSYGPKTGDVEAVLKDSEINPVSNILRVSGEFSILQFRVISHFHELGKNIRSCRNVFHVKKI